LLQGHPEFRTFDGLKEFYKSKVPSSKKIIKLFQAEPSNDAERESLAHLKLFVKFLEGHTLGKFCIFAQEVTSSHVNQSPLLSIP
jgi:hypothetical protein